VSSSFVDTAKIHPSMEMLSLICIEGKGTSWHSKVLAASKLVDQPITCHLLTGGETKLTWSPPVSQSKDSLRAAYQNTVDIGAREDFVLEVEQAFTIGDSGKSALGASADLCSVRS
jgi:hypothetical protein